MQLRELAMLNGTLREDGMVSQRISSPFRFQISSKPVFRFPL
jgi:hypothetical protein